MPTIKFNATTRATLARFAVLPFTRTSCWLPPGRMPTPTGLGRTKARYFYPDNDRWYFSHFDKPHVRIWDSVSLNTLQVIGQNGEFDRGVCCLAFSRLDGGNLLCVVDNSNEHVVSLWDWHKGSNGHRLAESKSTCDTVLAVEFHPIEKYTLISIGRGHIFFWDIEGGTLAKKLGLFEVKSNSFWFMVTWRLIYGLFAESR